MNSKALRLGKLGILLATAWVGHFSLSALPAIAQTNDIILEQTDVLESAYREHSFAGKAGQTVRITISSSDADLQPALWNLSGPGEEYVYYFQRQDIPSSANHYLATLPSDGDYTLAVQSYNYYDQDVSGDYTVSVDVATPYEGALSEGLEHSQSGAYQEAIDAFDRAIALEPTEAEAYQRRGDALRGLAQQLRPEEREAILESYQQALERYEAAGETELADYLRSEIMYLESSENGPVY